MYPNVQIAFKYIKNSYNSSTKRPNNSINKRVKDLNRRFSKDDIPMAKKHMKKWSMLLVISEMRVKTIVRHH